MLKTYYSQNGWDNYLQIDNLYNAEKFIETLQPNEYIGHGGTCIAFTSANYFKNNIIKVCIKNKLVLKNSKTFIDHANFLKANNIKILLPIDILYEDEFFFIYTQDLCEQINETGINNMVFIKMVEIIRELLIKKIKITDLFYKNFGIYKNDVYIYDYHDYDFFYSNDNYYICHIAHLLNLYYNQKLFYDICLDIDTLKNTNFGKNIIPDIAASLLDSLYHFDFDKAINNITNIIENTKDNNICKYNDYQFINIDRNGTINLDKHTREKFNVVQKIFSRYNKYESFTLIDYGCSLGGIGSKIAQLYPLSHITLNNITESELRVCREIKEKLLLSNVTINNNNFVENKESYDICLYFAILHHILKSHSLHDIINLITRQIKSYAIIELPFGNDILLQNVKRDGVRNYNESFYYLESIEIFENEINKYFDIINTEKIDYNTSELNRYAFTLKKKI